MNLTLWPPWTGSYGSGGGARSAGVEPGPNDRDSYLPRSSPLTVEIVKCASKRRIMQGQTTVCGDHEGSHMSITTNTETTEAIGERIAHQAGREPPGAGERRADVRLRSALCYANATPPL